MNKNTSMILIAAVAGIMIAGTLVVTMTTAAFATGCNGGIGRLGQPGGTGVNGGKNTDGSHNNANGRDADGRNAGDANGGQGCQSGSNDGN